MPTGEGVDWPQAWYVPGIWSRGFKLLPKGVELCGYCTVRDTWCWSVGGCPHEDTPGLQLTHPPQAPGGDARSAPASQPRHDTDTEVKKMSTSRVSCPWCSDRGWDLEGWPCPCGADLTFDASEESTPSEPAAETQAPDSDMQPATPHIPSEIAPAAAAQLGLALSHRGATLLSAVRAAGDQGLSHRSALSLCGRRMHHLAELTHELEAAGLIREAPDPEPRKGDRLYALRAS